MTMKITEYSGSNSQSGRDEVTQYINELTSKVSDDLKQSYQNPSELRTAEIALDVCAKLLEAHFAEKTRFGWSPRNP